MNCRIGWLGRIAFPVRPFLRLGCRLPSGALAGRRAGRARRALARGAGRQDMRLEVQWLEPKLALAPVAPGLSLGVGVADGATHAEATQSSGVVTVNGDKNASVVVSFVGTTNAGGDASKIVTKTVTGQGADVPVPVTLTEADLAKISDGPVYAVARQVDAAGDVSPNTVVPFTLMGVVVQFVTVGDIANVADTNGFGAATHAYQIAKYDVTIGQYTKFLNAVAATDTYNLYNPKMGTDLNVAGISRSGAPGSYAYAVMNNGGDSFNRPITYVSWFDAARFANWMHNGQPSGSQGPATTETGAYTLNGSIAGAAAVRNVGARFSLPTETEWYKAAYYKGGGRNAGYWDFATQSDTVPGNQIGSGANQANYWSLTTGLSVTQQGGLSADRNYLTDVGAFSGSASFYGTFDQTGDVFQWTDLDSRVSSDVLHKRGSGWDTFDALVLSAFFGGGAEPSQEDSSTGFRLAITLDAPVVALGAGVANGATRAEATQPSGMVTVVGESNTSIYVSFVGMTGGVGDPNKVVTKVVTGLGPVSGCP